MKIIYQEEEDILLIILNNQLIVDQTSYGQQLDLKLTENGIGQIIIHDAQSSGLLPVEVSPKNVFKKIDKDEKVKQKHEDKPSKKKKKCCKSYKKGKRCKNCPDVQHVK